MGIHRSASNHLFLFIFLLAADPALGQGKDPRSLVEEFQVVMLSVMKDARKLGVKGRYERLRPPIERTFNIPLMTGIATGAHSNRATESQRRRLISAFRRMSISTLATFLDDYSGEIFKTFGDGLGPRNTHLVNTKLVKSDASTVDIAYIVKTFGGRWLIIDVIVAGGISELSVRRSEYRRLLKEQGVEGLIDALNAKADRLISD